MSLVGIVKTKKKNMIYGFVRAATTNLLLKRELAHVCVISDKDLWVLYA
jgi:hypothetical protein